jgi:hypothetical protein
MASRRTWGHTCWANCFNKAFGYPRGDRKDCRRPLCFMFVLASQRPCDAPTAIARPKLGSTVAVPWVLGRLASLVGCGVPRERGGRCRQWSNAFQSFRQAVAVICVLGAGLRLKLASRSGLLSKWSLRALVLCTRAAYGRPCANFALGLQEVPCMQPGGYLKFIAERGVKACSTVCGQWLQSLGCVPPVLDLSSAGAPCTEMCFAS